jgi:hypothetical protein
MPCTKNSTVSFKLRKTFGNSLVANAQVKSTYLLTLASNFVAMPELRTPTLSSLWSTLLILLFSVSPVLAQSWVNVDGCAAITHRSNGNGGSASCAGETGIAVAPNFVGTTFANVPTGTKTGDIRLNWTALTGTVYPPAISAVYESSNGGAATLAPIVVGPPTDFSSSTGGNGYDYCFYSSTNYNLNAAQTLVFELKDPQSGDIFGYCAYDFTTNPPTSTSLPAGLPLDAGTISGNQTICSGGDAGAFVSNFDASGGSGSITYGWQSSTDNATWNTIIGAVSKVYDVPSGLTVTTYYRRIASDGFSSVLSNVVAIQVGSTPAFTATAAPTNVSCFSGDDGAIDLTVLNAVQPVTYIWSTGAVTEDVQNLEAGNYSVLISDASGCTENLTFTLSSPTKISLGVVKTDINCFGQMDGSIAILASGGTPPYSYSWNSGATSPIRSNLASGIYTVTITDAAGCSKDTSISILEPTALMGSFNI